MKALAWITSLRHKIMSKSNGKQNGTPNLDHLFTFDTTPDEMEARFPINGHGPSYLLWLQLQTLLPIIQRWKNYRENDPEIMYQDGLMHTLSQLWTYLEIHDSLTQKGEAENIDLSLMIKALLLHDVGEPLRKFEKLYYDKSWEDDVAEYNLFVEFIDNLGFELDTKKQLVKAFLLQFCLCSKTLEQNPDLHHFPEEAQTVIQNLIRFHYKEAIVFMFTENIDYWRYTVSMYRITGHMNAFKSVCVSNVEPLDMLVKKLPALSKTWTPEMSALAKQFRTDHPDVPIDAPGVPSDRT